MKCALNEALDIVSITTLIRLALVGNEALSSSGLDGFASDAVRLVILLPELSPEGEALSPSSELSSEDEEHILLPEHSSEGESFWSSEDKLF